MFRMTYVELLMALLPCNIYNVYKREDILRRVHEKKIRLL